MKSRKWTAPICPYCDRPSELLRNSTQLYGRDFGPVWICWTCRAWVGCHRDSKRFAPLGRLANAELRTAKIRAHDAFDPIWRYLVERHGYSKGFARHKAYEWLAERMGLTIETAHIGMFDVAQCDRVVEVCGEYRREERAV